MSVRIHRVVVRGQFADLTDDQRAALLAEAADHDLHRSAFTEWGTFTYDTRLVAFNFRYEVRLDDEDPPADPLEIGLAKATASLDQWSLHSKHLRATSTDMTTMWPP